MSWLRSAVNKAVEVSGRRTSVSRTVRSYADTFAGGARILQDRIGMRNRRSFRNTMKRLEEIAISSKGEERVQLLRRWLVALRQIERVPGGIVDDRDSVPYDKLNSPNRNASLDLSYCSDVGGDLSNFREVFLQSQALEGITMSMILEEPNDEEASLLLEIFGLCFTGGKEVQSTVIGSIRNLAKAFSHYQDEVLVKREELLQYAQSAISGLKLNPELTRIDAEASELWKSVNKMKGLQVSTPNGLDMTSRDTALPTVEALKNALAEIQLCSRLEMLLLKKQSIKNGDSAESHSQKACSLFSYNHCFFCSLCIMQTQACSIHHEIHNLLAYVHKLKILAESLANSSSKAEMRIVDQRRQTEEAHNFRVAKASEVSEIEKELVTEILDLERQRDELEVELKKINTRLTAALTRLQKSREERNQFDEASNQIVLHLKAKEDELSRSVASCKLEGDVVHTWINFLESTWVHQSANTDLKEKQTNDELEKYESYFMKLIKHHLLACKVEVGSCLTHIKTIVDNLKIFSEGSTIKSIASDDISNETNPRQILEEDYLKAETKIVTAFNVVDHMKELFYLEQENPFRKQDPQVKELFNDVDKLRVEFGSIQRPTLEIEISKDKVSVSEGTLQSQKTSHSAKTTYSPMSRGIESSNSAAFVIDLQSEKEMERLEPDLFPMSTGSSHEEIAGWEFDEPEHEQRYSESAEKNQS
ncbi:hypothetical protein IHE45_18G102400 [Dioscorea alata]|uniref:Uncharacterized protein n=1 Tax=Dioscorea alata TaxID=55571 RepID=A0ACB7U956_DIOAL|nr:hypothetical protein IHE45_18G102400 [Dioscorea alata]